MAVALAWCLIGSGKYAGRRAIEARLDGHRIGELTHRMSQRYTPLVAEVLARGGQPGCVAVLRHGDRGIQAELRLPAVEAGRAPVEDADVSRAGTADVATGRPGVEDPDAAVTIRFPTVAPATPAGTWTPAAGHAEPAGPPRHPGRADHPGHTGSAWGRPGLDRARPWLIAAGVVTLLLVVAGIVGGGEEPSTSVAAAPVTPSVAAPAPAAVLAAPGPSPATDPVGAEPTTQTRRADPAPTRSAARTTAPATPERVCRSRATSTARAVAGRARRT